MKKSSLIGDKQFYKMVLGLALPIMIQNGISNFVNLLDNLMIGQVGTNALSGVAIANQLIFVYYLLTFGASAGIGIFTAQYHGTKDTEGVRYTLRTKIVVNIIISAITALVFALFGGEMVKLFLEGEGTPEDIRNTLIIGRSYLYIIIISFLPISFTQTYASTLRETGQTKVPMYASFAAVLINLVGNYILIYGHFGLPALGADGAAIATVISRFIEASILIIYTHTHKEKNPFIEGAYKTLAVPGHLLKKYLVKSMPLMMNEGLWSLGVTILNQCYSYKSYEAVASINIEVTLYNLLGVAFLAMGDAVGIIVGQILGKGDIEKAKDYAGKLTAFTVFCGVLFGFMMGLISPYFPLFYNTTDTIRNMATCFILINAMFMPVQSYLHASYFIIRSGGRTGITMIFDSCFMLMVSVPIAYYISRYTNIDIIIMMIAVLSVDLIKCIIGGAMVGAGIWARNIVKN